MLEYTIEQSLLDKGYTYVCGVDEAGRGPLCGPVVAAACILPVGLYIEGLNDSKKLSPKKRKLVFEEIKKYAIAYCIAEASVEEIDALNILEADMLAMKRAVEGLCVKADFAIIDGNVSRGFNIPTMTVIKGDATSYNIAAASILAKVARDRIMREYDKEYPEYGFEKHKGYGTAVHIKTIKEIGPCPIHRRSFIKNFVKE